MGRLSGNSFSGTGGKAGRNKGVSGGFGFHTGITGIIQGYVDCVQALYYLGIIRETEGPQWMDKKEKQMN